MTEDRGGPDTRARPTLQTVASVAKVSKATASRVINGEPKVSAHARKAVEAAIAQLGYVPNRAARSLVTHRADSLALVAPAQGLRTALYDPYFSAVAVAAGDDLAAKDAHLILFPVRDSADHDRLLRYARGGHLDGVILLSVHGADPLPGILQSAGVPTVMGGRLLHPVSGVSCVDVDNVAGARIAVEHLVERGRRRIGTIAGAQDMCSGIDRLAGYRSAIEAAGLGPGIVSYGDFGEDSAIDAAEEILRNAPDLDALYVASDVMASATLRVLRRTGRRVPEDVAVVGNDDLGIAKHTVPSLTTIRQPIEQVAATLVAHIVAKVAGEPVPDSTVYPPDLVIRESS